MVVSKKTDDFELKRQKIELEKLSAESELDADEQSDIIRMRNRWSNWLLGALLVIMGFDLILITLVGFNVWSFEGKVLPIFIFDSLLKVIGLAYIVVNFLFNKDFIARRK